MSAADVGAGGESDAFASLYSFGLDDFQRAGCASVESGRSVLVAAPTGSGKTVIGEFAVHMGLSTGRKTFYTTPIKALSNQKYADLVSRYGPERVGLLTGDTSINGEAPVVVMTTEVLRNMLYAQSTSIHGLGYVVMDEVHYLADRTRGAVWEEVILHLPDSVSIVALSATVSNAEEFGDWLATVRGETDVIVEEHRPVPLWQHVISGNKMFDLFVDDEQEVINPELLQIARQQHQSSRMERGGRGATRGRTGRRVMRSASRTAWTPSRAEVVRRLEREGLLPAITFIFSRAGCNAAVEQCVNFGVRLTTQQEREQISLLAEEFTSHIPEEDLAVLDYDVWLDGLERGVAAHHAGMLPAFKETVEKLFSLGLLKAVFATETLALGINMPARTVVLEKLVKWNGETHAEISAGEYTQLTGRAGRRGIDVEGHAVVLWHQGFEPGVLAGLASTRTYPLRSSFKPSYNMAVNLVETMGFHVAREVLETSFAQFQADKAVVGLAAQVRRNEEGLEGYAEAMQCHLGDFAEYSAIRRRITDLERHAARRGAAHRRDRATESLERLRPGDVIVVPSGRRAGPAVVIDPGLSPHSDPRPQVLTADKQVKRLSVIDFQAPVESVMRLRIPKSFNPRNPQSRRDLAAALKERLQGVVLERPRRERGNSALDSDEIDELRVQMRRHPCHGCDERESHARWAERYHKLLRETQGLQSRIEGRTNSIARQFDRVCELLARLGYLEGSGEDVRVTPSGQTLGGLYAEQDLLAAECLRRGVWDDLDPAELASAASALIYESRNADDAPPRIPHGAVRDALTDMTRIWAELESAEKQSRLSFVAQPDVGFSWAAHRWASGQRLDVVLRESDLAPGDFVRWSKQLVDLLGQISQASNGSVSRNARLAAESIRRGVVSYSGLQ